MRSGRVLRVLAGAVASETAYHSWIAGRDTWMEPMSEYAQLQLRFVDSVQRRSEVIRPIILIGDRTAAQRAEETQLHPETVRELTRRFRQQGMLGLLPEHTAIITPSRDKTVKKLWQQSLTPVQGELPLHAYHSHPQRYQGRLEVIKLYYQGWTKRSICGFLNVSRPTVDRWLGRFEAEHFAGLVGFKPGPKSPRKVWFPLMVDVYHLQKAHPDAGEFRIWSLLAQEDISVRTVGRVMALNRQVYDDIPHQRKPAAKQPPQPHPYKATRPHQYWFIDGRMMDCALEGVRWWSLIMLEGYSRTILAGAVAPSEASWVALMVLSTAFLRYGVPECLISDSGGAFTANEFEAVCTRLQIDHKPMESTKGESYLNWMETHFNVQRRLYDYQFSLSTTPLEFEQAHQAFMELYNTTAHQGLLKDRCDPPIPLVVLGEAKGRLYTPEELTRKFSRALFPRTTNPYGCVTLHSYHFYVEQGVPQTQVLLWVYGEQLRAVLDNVVLAEYHCRYDWRTHKVMEIRDGVFYPTRFASPQGALIPLTPQESLVLYRPQTRRRQAPKSVSTQQLVLFELVRTG